MECWKESRTVRVGRGDRIGQAITTMNTETNSYKLINKEGKLQSSVEQHGNEESSSQTMLLIVPNIGFL